LRFLPALNFSNRTISYRTASGEPFPAGNAGRSISVLSLPLDFPLFLKWTAVREKNYRPYVTVGGGLTFDVYRDKQLPVLSKPLDGFVGVGAGCNIYLPWFRLCPEIRYQIGFNNLIVPVDERSELQQQQQFYNAYLTYCQQNGLNYNDENEYNKYCQLYYNNMNNMGNNQIPNNIVGNNNINNNQNDVYIRSNNSNNNNNDPNQPKEIF
jgi:hypothetical protein